MAIKRLLNFLLHLSVYLYVVKQRILHIITFLLLAIFLIGTVGVPVSKHVCLLSGHEDVAFFADKDFKGCCTDDGCTKPQADEKDSCCDDENEFLKLNIVKKHEEHQDGEAAIPVTSVLTPAQFLTANTDTWVSQYPMQYCNLPPPRSGTDILLAVQVFLL